MRYCTRYSNLIAISFTFLIILLIHPALYCQTKVIKCPNRTGSLADRWRWAGRAAQEHPDGCWVGYSFSKLMSENSWIGSYRDSEKDAKPTLREILEGSVDNPSLEEIARRALEKRDDTASSKRKVEKEIALLYYFSDGSADVANSKKLRISNLDLTFDLQGKPLLWLGDVPHVASVNFLVESYADMDDKEIKEDCIAAISLHPDFAEVFAFLKDVVKNEKNDELREDAVFWISQLEGDEVLDFLLATVKHDKSSQVREQAVFAISQVDADGATDALIDLAKHADEDKIQKKAIFWLGQKAADRSVETLEEVAYDKNTVEIQKQAVFALSQLSEGKGVSSLIEIARKHPHREVRKNAIFWLGQSDDPRALDTIIALLKR